MPGNAEETEATRAVVEQVYRRFEVTREVDIAPSLADDIDWSICVPTYLFEFAGPRRGRAEVQEALSLGRSRFEVLDYAITALLADGDWACVYARVTTRDRESGQSSTADNCDLLRVRNGKVVWFRGYFDAATAALELFGGRPSAG